MDSTPTPEASPPGSRWPRWALAGLLVLAVAAFYASGLGGSLSWEAVRTGLDGWQEQARRNFVPALAVFFVVYVAVAALSLPAAALLTLLGGALFGRWVGTAVVSVAATLGATLAFLASRYVLRDGVRRRFGGALGPIDRGVERDGAYYLFTLRLVPAVPFFLVNLAMGLTPMRATTFAAVSWVGMLPGTFLYANAGTELAALDAPGDLLSWGVLGSLALLGVAPLLLRKFIQWKVRWRTVGLAFVGLVVVVAVGLAVRTHLRYQKADAMAVPVREYTNAEYPEDPAHRGPRHGQYNGRRLALTRTGDGRFDFVFESDHAHVARVAFRDVDVGLMSVNAPAWAKDDPGLLRIALTDREWNRQQVRFGGPADGRVEVAGGDGWERTNLYSAELARNCLNAGLWEVLLFEQVNGEKALYYQGWFTFPLGHYKDVFEGNTGLPYWRHWYYLEHWFDPAGTAVPLGGLRTVVRERDVPATFDRAERVIAAGEQARKRRTTVAENVVTWGDFYDGRPVRFASFIPPGRYSVGHPWKNEYRRIDRFERAVLREVTSPAKGGTLAELELVFSSTRTAGRSRFLVGGFDLAALPRLPVADYPKGLYMPMGIGVPPFFQTHEELRANPPERSPYFSVLLDEEGRWIDHHRFAIDGPVLHRDEKDPDLLHVYLLSYERHSLIAHLVVRTGSGEPVP